MVKVSIVITVKNEADTIEALFHALSKQTHRPDEVIIVDGGSTDNTYTLLQRLQLPWRKVVVKKVGNRSLGRNMGVVLARNDIIAFTDAGCEPDSTWLQEIVQPFEQEKIDVVAGYYRALAQSSFERAAAAYMLVMPENIKKNTFLPATRSMAIRKSAWVNAGGFPHEYSMNEDYVFAHRLLATGAVLQFQQTAVVGWHPPHTWSSFFTQVYRFAFGDTQAGMYRPKMISIFFRYVIGLVVYFFSPLLCILLFMGYMCWAVHKNYRYVHDTSALWILPLMQVGTDIAVMVGSTRGFVQRLLSHT
ncbi:MAG: glycosyltransferase [Candidatus Pacebacteria bacterium]|nr:glycosyltransferase [Candidatus Paceibacterota bacterium]